MRTAFQGAVVQMLPVYDLILLLKVARDGACLTSSSRLFQRFKAIPKQGSYKRVHYIVIQFDSNEMNSFRTSNEHTLVALLIEFLLYMKSSVPET